MKISDQFPTRFISASDLDKSPTGTPFVILKLVKEECIHPRTKKPDKVLAVYFRGAIKAHRLRKSEYRKLVELWGDDDAGWTDKTVTLTKVSTPTGDGVRLKPVAEGGAK